MRDIRSLETLHDKAKSSAEDIIYPLAERLGILNRTMKTPEIEIEFQFSKNRGVKESLSKQLRYGDNYSYLAKALINIDKLLENALLIENHSDKYKDSSRENEILEMVHVLLSAFKDGDQVIPVQFEVKKLSDTSNRLYITVTITKIEAGVLGSTPVKTKPAS